MDSSATFIEGGQTNSGMLRPDVIQKTCEVLFYGSLILLGMTVIFSPKIIQIITFLATILLGSSMLLSKRSYLLTAIYILNITLLTAITIVPFYVHRYDISIITFIPLLVSNKILLKDSKHFWYLLLINVIVALCYILFANLEVKTNDFIVEGMVFFLNVFILIKVLYYAENERKTHSTEEKKRLAFLQGIVDINPQMIYAKSKVGKFTFVNKLFADSMGLSKEQIIGKTDFDIGISKEKALAYISRDIAVMDSNQTDQLYEELIDEDGETKYFQSIRSPLRDNEGNVTGVLGVSMDRSEEKISEKKLSDAKILYQALFDNLHDGVIVYDYEAEKISSCNDAAMKILLIDKDKISKYDRFQFFPKVFKGVDVHKELSSHKEKILNSQIIKGNAVMKRTNGELFECKLSVYPTPNKNARGITVIKDVSLEVKAKKDIIKSKNYFMQIYDNSPVAISLTSIDTMKVSDINATHEKIFGYTLDKLQSLSIQDVIPGIDLVAQNKVIDKLRNGSIDKNVVEREFVNNENIKLIVRSSQSIITREGKEYLMEFIEDITEAHRQEARYKFLFENAFDGIAVNDYAKSELIDCNSKFKEFIGLSDSFDISKYKTLDYSPKLQDNGLSSLEYFKQNYKRIKTVGSLDFNWKFLLKDGTIKYADVSLIQDISSQKNLTYAIYRETTNERMIQQALKESEKRFRLIFDNAFDGLYFYNYKKQKIILANNRLYELFETTPDRLLVDKPHLKPEFQPDGTSTLEKLTNAFNETLEKGKSRSTRIYVKSDGTIVHLEISTFLLSPPDDDIIVSIYKDITDQKIAKDAQILNATHEEKLDALGRELSSYTLFTIQKNKLLQELSEDLKIMTTLENGESKVMAEKVRRKIAGNLDEKENWLSFKVQFERVHPGFIAKLEKNFSDISTNDLKHCAYIKMGLSNSEIADVLFVGKKAVEMSHYRLKKKLGFPKELTLKQALQKF